MTAQEEVQARALKMTERTSKTIEQGRVAVRDADPDLAEKERQEERPRTFREPPPASPERTAAFRQLDIAAQKLMHAHPDKYRTRAVARTRARELDPRLKAREITEERTANMSTRTTRHAEHDIAAKLKDGQRDAANENRARREATTAFVELHIDDVQRRVDDDDLDLEAAVQDVIRASLVPAFKTKIKGGRTKAKTKAASTLSPQLFAERVIKKMRSGPSGHDLRPSIEHVMASRAG